MRLERLSVDGFRCFGGLPDIPFHQLTVFIGENDAGKTAVLDSLEILLTARQMTDGEYHRTAEVQTAECRIIGYFTLSEVDKVPDDWRTHDGKGFTLIRSLSATGARSQVEGRGFADARWETFAKQPAPTQRELLEAIGIVPGANGTAREQQFIDATAAGTLPKVSRNIDIPFGQIAPHLPRFERVSSADYRQPDTMVQRVMQAVVDSCLRPTDPITGERSLLEQLKPVEGLVRDALNGKAAEMRSILQALNPKITDVAVAPSIDFSRSITTAGLLIDVGRGLHPVQSFGEGSKKRLWMGLLEWERATQRQLASVPVLRVYDEPDVNLDYAAERQLFNGILESTRATDTNVQVVVCTHAMTFVDRAPADCINVIRAEEDGKRTIEHLQGSTDEDIRAFVETLSRSVGLSNSSLFYERAFLLVEGESEENAVPQLYRNMYGRSLVEDAIVLVNLFTCSAWKGVLKVLLRNKASSTVMLLDKDCEHSASSAYITTDSLLEIGYPEDFKTTSCFFVGTKEFEDAFATADILEVLARHWPKPGGATWTVQEIDALRQAPKFSDALLQSVRTSCDPPKRSSARKPEFAARLAEHCKTMEQVPHTVKAALDAVRARAGIMAGDDNPTVAT